MRRIVVVGGRGFFGAAAAALLREAGESPLVASRSGEGGDRLDAEDPDQLRTFLQAGDIVLDAAGPFQKRSMALVEAGLEKGCDVIDLSDSVDFVTKIRDLAPAIERSGSRVVPACSSVSAVSAALVRWLGVDQPVRVSTFLAPATRNTSTAGIAGSLFANLGRPARILRGGALVERVPFSERRSFDCLPPVGRIDGRLGECTDVVLLPLVWPSLRDVDFWVDSRRGWMNTMLSIAARNHAVRGLVRAASVPGRRIAKRMGARAGGFAIEVEDDAGAVRGAGFVHGSHSYLVAVAPAVLAALALRNGTFRGEGWVTPDQAVEPGELVAFLERKGVHCFVHGAPLSGKGNPTWR